MSHSACERKVSGPWEELTTGAMQQLFLSPERQLSVVESFQVMDPSIAMRSCVAA